MITSIPKHILCLLCFFFMMQEQTVYSQTKVEATKPIESSHSPKLATTLSAVLPGAGQIYNRKYWKFPLVYAIIGGCAYMTIQYNQEYVTNFGELKYRIENPGLRFNTDLAAFEDAQIQANMSDARRWRDNFIVFSVLGYILNIVDANVDAHLFHFDVSPDLSLNLTPYTQYTERQAYGGVSLRLQWKGKKQ